MSQTSKEQEQKKLLFKLFSNGELEECMDKLQTGNDQLELFQKVVEKVVDFNFLYTFDFKYLLGNYYKVYQGEKYTEFKGKIDTSILEDGFESNINSIELWYVYKEIDKKNKKKSFDCDSWNGTNDLMDEIYDRLWRNVKEWDVDWGTYKKNEKFGGDTMNSFSTTFNALAEKKSYRESFKDYRIYKNSKYKILEKYAKYTGCLGNFTLVPRGYNGYRGTSNKLKDYWDLSLNNLRYDKDGQEWLEGVNLSFREYINMFFLWDYMESQDGKYRVKALFEGHEALLNPVNNVLPRKYNQRITDKETEDEGNVYRDFKEFTETANRCILRRGVFMVAMLEIEAKGDSNQKNDYQKIVNYLATDKCLGTMEEVLNKLINRSRPEEIVSDEAKKVLDKCIKELKKIDEDMEAKENR